MQQKAFNLVVLMSVVVIIAILAGVSVPQYLAQNRRVEVVELDLGGHFGLTKADGRDGFGRDTICGCCFCWRI